MKTTISEGTEETTAYGFVRYGTEEQALASKPELPIQGSNALPSAKVSYWKLQDVDPKSVNAYRMARFSTKRQKKGTSEARQLERAKEECIRRGWRLDDDLEIMDLGLSAFKGLNFKKGSQLGQFIEAARLGLLKPHAVLIVENPDRFSRECVDVADSVLWELVRLGVHVLFLTPYLYCDDPSDASTRTRLMWEFERAHNESTRKQDFTYSVLKRKIEAAREGIPQNFGNMLPSWIGWDKGEKDFIFKEERKAVVERMIDMYFEGKSAYRIKRLLESEGVKWLGNAWGAHTVTKILRSPALMGTFSISIQDVRERPPKTLEFTIPNYLPKILEKERWDALQVKLAESIFRKGAHERNHINNLFPGMVTCVCGRSCTVQISRNNGRDAYRCNAIDHAETCPCGGTKRLRSLVIEMDFIGGYLKTFPQDLINADDKDLQAKISRLKKEVRDLDKKLDAAESLVGKMDPQRLGKLMESLTKSHRKAKAELDQAVSSSYKSKASFGAWQRAMRILDAKTEWNAEGRRVLDAASRELEAQVLDQKIRPQLVKLFRAMIQGIVLDIGNYRYAVKLTTGELTRWRDVKSLVAAYKLAARNLRKDPVWRAEHAKRVKAGMKKKFGENYETLPARIWNPKRRAERSQLMLKVWVARKAQKASIKTSDSSK